MAINYQASKKYKVLKDEFPYKEPKLYDGCGTFDYELEQIGDAIYHVSMQVRKALPDGKLLGVSGDIPELGLWKDFSVRCKKDGDLWYLDKPI